MDANIRQLIAQQNEKDRKDGRLLIMMGVPFSVVGWIGMAGALWLVQLLAWTVLPWKLTTASWIAGTVALVAIIVDCIVHPSEEWYEARYFLVDGASATNTGAMYGRAGGVFDGMPLMTNMSDPSNMAERGKVITSGCSNVVLAGPRQIRKGFGKLVLAKLRSDPRIMESTEAFVGWLREAGSTTPEDVEAILVANSRWRPGARLAVDMGLVRRIRDANGSIAVRLAVDGK